jgi:hypothetical protein
MSESVQSGGSDTQAAQVTTYTEELKELQAKDYGRSSGRPTPAKPDLATP